MRSWPPDSVDHCIADPPFNMSKKQGLGWAFSSHVTMQEAWDQFEDDDFVQFNIDWLSQVLRVVKPNGNILVFGTMHNKAAETEHAEKCRALRRSRSSPTHNLHQFPRLDRRRAAPLRRARPTHGDPRVVPTSAAPGGQAFVQSVQPGKDATLGEGALTKASAQRALTQALHQRDTGSAWKSGSVSQRCACRREMSAASAACVSCPEGDGSEERRLPQLGLVVPA